MKRIFIAILCIILFFLVGCSGKEVRYIDSTQGRILICKNDTYILIDNNSPIVLDIKDAGDIGQLSDGDLVEVWHGEVMESYPAKTKAHKISLIEKGSMGDIDENIARQLSEAGWIDYEDMVERYIGAGYIIDCETPDNNVSSKHLYCDMSLDIPNNWLYEVKESDTECYIRFRPSDEKDGWVILQCTKAFFGVCGTGLECEDQMIGRYNAQVCTYDNNSQFSFIRFTDTAGDYIIRNIQNESWFHAYEDEIMAILDTVILSPEQLSYEEISAKIKESYISDYENITIRFDCFEGVWVVDYYIDSVNYQLKLDTNGEVMAESEE